MESETRIMKRLSSLTALFLMASLLGGCATSEVKPSDAFTAASDTSLVVLGVEVKSVYKQPQLAFIKYDPVTGKSDPSGRVFASRPLTSKEKLRVGLLGQRALSGGHSYFVFRMPPGDWMLMAVHGNFNGMAEAHSLLSEGTIAFTTRPGAAIYVGEYAVTGNLSGPLSIAQLQSDLAAAQAELDSYPGAEVKLSYVEPTHVRFTCEKGLIATCDLDTIAVTRMDGRE
jgi:hypothetical protein